MQSLIIVRFRRWAGGAPGSTMCCSSSTLGIFGRGAAFARFILKPGPKSRWFRLARLSRAAEALDCERAACDCGVGYSCSRGCVRLKGAPDIARLVARCLRYYFLAVEGHSARACPLR